MEVAILDAIAEDDPSSKETPNVPISVKQIDVSSLCVCPVIDHEFRHHIVKVAVDRLVDLQTAWTML